MIKRKKYLILILYLFTITTNRCTYKKNDFKVEKINSNITCKIREFKINKLGFEYQSYAKQRAILEKLKVCDENGIAMKKMRGKKYYSPVRISQYILNYLAEFEESNDPTFLNKAELFAKKLLDISYITDESIYFPYNFDWFLHNNKHDILEKPWYSGMAQGQALSVFVRLYKVTNNKEYLDIAEKVFNSFLYTKNIGYDPWTVYIDEEGYYWIEEYPCEVPTHVLNGFIHGFFGLYDYYLLTNDNLCKKLMKVSLTTIYFFIDRYRNKNNLSYYCLKHKSKYESYHIIHIDQLKILYKITGEYRFKLFSNFLYSDYQNYTRVSK